MMDILRVPRRSVAMLSNHCAIGKVLEKACDKWDKGFERMAYIHYYYREPISECEPQYNMNYVRDLVAEYALYAE